MKNCNNVFQMREKISYVKLYFQVNAQYKNETLKGTLIHMLGWSRSVNLERLAIYWPGCVFWAFLWLFPALKLKPHSTVASMLVLISCVIPTMEFEEERSLLVRKVYSICKEIDWLTNWSILSWVFTMQTFSW